MEADQPFPSQSLSQVKTEAIRLEVKLLAALLFYLPLAYSKLGRIYLSIAGLSASARVDASQAFLIPSFLIGVVLLALRYSRYPQVNKHPLRYLIEFSFVCWFVGATLSSINQWNINRTAVNYVSTFITLPILYHAARDMALSRKDLNVLFTALCLGTLPVLTISLYYYYKAFSVPSLLVLLLSRYDIPKMTGYREWTFGNTGNTAAFLMLTMFPVMMMFRSKENPKHLHRLYGFTFFLMCVHFVIIQSRVTFIIALALLPVLIFLFSATTKQFLTRITGLIVFFTVLIGILFATGSTGLITLLDRFQNAASANQEEDDSVRERVHSMVQGRRVFETHWEMGIGIGNTRDYILETAVHQFNLNQGTELGILGFIASILLCIGTAARTAIFIFEAKRKAWGWERLAFALGPFCYLVYGAIGNMPLNIGVINTWMSLLILFTAFYDYLPIEETTPSTP